MADSIWNELNKHQSERIELGHDVMGKNLQINSLDLNSPTFQSASSGGTQTLSNVHGASLDINFFGKNENLSISSLTREQQPDGSVSYRFNLENPLPQPVQQIFAASKSIPLDLTVKPNGSIEYPSGSELFDMLAGQNGKTLPGMIASDAFSDAGSVAQFLEANPQWAATTLTSHIDGIIQTFSKPSTQQPADKQSPSTHPTTEITQPAADQVTPKRSDSPSMSALFPANPKQLEPGQTYDEYLNVDGQQRHFIVHVPKNYDPNKPAPLLVILHGLGETGQSLMNLSGANALSDKEGFIVAYPDATDWLHMKGLNVWDTGNGLTPPGQHANDVQFLNNILDSVEKQGNVDQRRVYLAGVSNGAMMSYVAAGELSGRIASVATISGAMSSKEPRPKEPLSLINVHGTADPVIPFKGLADTPPVLKDIGVPMFEPTQYATDYYRNLDGIEQSPKVTQDGKVTIQTSSNPANHTEVEQYTINGDGHMPSNIPAVMNAVWDFLAAHPKQTAPNEKDDHIAGIDKPIDQWTTVQQLNSAVQKRGVAGIEDDADNVFNAVTKLPDGSISPSKVLEDVRQKVNLKFNDPVSQFIEQTPLVSKNGGQINIEHDIPMDIKLGATIPGGKFQSVSLGNLSFDMKSNNGLPELANIKGITLNAQVGGFNLASRIEDLKVEQGTKPGQGRIYDATMQNPISPWLRDFLMAPDSFNVELSFDQNGKQHVVNANHTASQLIGKNPWVGGLAADTQDTISAISNPSVGTGAQLGLDVGLTAGVTYLGARSLGMIGGGLGFLAAPLAVDVVRKYVE